MSEIDESILGELKQEIERLQNELAVVNHEKIQSAQYGLVLLEEKQSLQQKAEEMELLYENAKHDLHCATEALAKFQSSHRASTKTGIEQEESLISESASREASLTSTIFDLENEVKQLRQENDRIEAEKERTLQELNDFVRDKDNFDYETKNIRLELRELKRRETKLLSEYSELEEENVSLQKQVSNLKSSQVEFEGVKHELRRHQEEAEVLSQQVEDLTKLKCITEKQMEEALEALQAEREQRYALKKELDQKLNNDTMLNFALRSWRYEGLCEDSNKLEEDESGGPILKRLEADFSKNDRGGSGDESNPSVKHAMVGDLFSEVHLNQIRKLEKQLETAENTYTADINQLNKHLKQTQELLGKAKQDADCERIRGAMLIAQLAVLEQIYGPEYQLLSTENDDEKMSREEVLNNQNRQYEMAGRQIAELSGIMKNIREKEKENGDENFDVVSRLREEVTKLRTKIVDYEQVVCELKDDLITMSDIAGESQSSIAHTHDELSTISDTLSQLHNYVCHNNGRVDQTPTTPTAGNLTMDSITNGSPPSSLDTTSRVVALCDRLRSPEGRRLAECAAGTISSATCSRQLIALRDQVKFLKRAMETVMEGSRPIGTISRDGQVTPDYSDNEELQEQVLKLKSLLSTKREQIATLRTVMKANKQTAEVALANLKNKYENEKSVVSETMIKLRNELKALKEDAATFASLRAMFAARCEEYVTQIDEMQQHLSSAEEEKKTLNSLLRLAIQQKLALTQRLEDMEMDRERNTMRRGRGSSNSRSGPRGGLAHPSSNFGFRSHDHHHYQRRDY
ncbi:hypothetical protein CHUAL_008528 [Chamberlinius hualienensis]